MNDTEYDERVDAILIQIEDALDVLDEREDIDIDYESADGMLTLIFANKTKIIINKQPPLHQIWVATKFNGHHFEFKDGVWIDNRSGEEFWTLLNDSATKQAGETIKFN